MKRSLVLAALITSTVAHAQPGVTEAPGAAGELSDPGLEGGQRTPQAELPHEQRLVEKLTSTARMAARDGQCRAIAVIRQRVRELDAAYYRDVFAADAAIADCVEGVSHRPPAAPAAPITPRGPDAVDVAPPDTVVRREQRAPYTSPGVALALSLGTPLAGVALVGAAWASANARTGGGFAAARMLTLAGTLAITLGPTAGHFYAGTTWNTGLKLRLIGLGATLGGFAVAIGACGLGSRGCDNAGAAGLGALSLLGGAVTYGAGTIYEIATAPGAARAANRRRDPQLAGGPMLGHAPGLALAGTF